ncbi:hypothetical protein CsSME_00003862 [Camellia sinensis var. sinensis]
MAPHTSSPSPTTASQSGKLAVILATSIPALLSSPSATTTSTSSILPALSSGSSTSPAAAFPPLPSTTQVTSSLEIPPIWSSPPLITLLILSCLIKISLVAKN